jgi:hypothetical protein
LDESSSAHANASEIIRMYIHFPNWHFELYGIAMFIHFPSILDIFGWDVQKQLHLSDPEFVKQSRGQR